MKTGVALRMIPAMSLTDVTRIDLDTLFAQPSDNITESLDDILFVADRIGEGGFSTVYKCKLEEKRCAVKCISKCSLDDYQRIQLLNEIQILQTMKHPMIVDIMHVLQDSDAIHIITELLVCGDMFDYLAATTLEEAQIVFYTTNVIIIFEHLHRHGVIYRDLKSENLIMMENGYLKLIDFGFAKQLKSSEKTYTVLGTPGYIAPEIMLGGGYSQPVDWWTLGIFVFDTMFKRLPFGDDIFKVVNNSKQPIEFPKESQFSKESERFIISLLTHNPEKRLSRYNIKSQRWFVENGVNWMHLYSFRVTPKYIPAKRRFGSTYVKYTDSDITPGTCK